jgi:hypothetical protein
MSPPNLGPSTLAPVPQPAHHVEDRLLPLKQTTRHHLDPPTTFPIFRPELGPLSSVDLMSLARIRSVHDPLSFFTVVFDADDPQLVGRFWAAALERGLTEGDPGEWATLPGDPRIDFMKVPEGKTTKNRMHLDWSAADREAEVQRLLGLGATRLWDVKEKVGEEDMEWTALADTFWDGV